MNKKDQDSECKCEVKKPLHILVEMRDRELRLIQRLTPMNAREVKKIIDLFLTDSFRGYISINFL